MNKEDQRYILVDNCKDCFHLEYKWKPGLIKEQSEIIYYCPLIGYDELIQNVDKVYKKCPLPKKADL